MEGFTKTLKNRVNFTPYNNIKGGYIMKKCTLCQKDLNVYLRSVKNNHPICQTCYYLESDLEGSLKPYKNIKLTINGMEVN